MTPTQIIKISRELKAAKAIKHPLNYTTLRAWCSGHRQLGLRNQPVGIPFPDILCHIYWQGGREIYHIPKPHDVFAVIAWNELRHGERWEPISQLAKTLEQNYAKITQKSRRTQ